MARCGPGSSTSPPHLRGGDPILLCGTRRGFWLPGGDGPGRGCPGRDEAHGACAELPCGLYRHYEVLPGGLLQLVGAVAVPPSARSRCRSWAALSLSPATSTNPP